MSLTLFSPFTSRSTTDTGCALGLTLESAHDSAASRRRLFPSPVSGSSQGEALRWPSLDDDGSPDHAVYEDRQGNCRGAVRRKDVRPTEHLSLESHMIIEPVHLSQPRLQDASGTVCCYRGRLDACAVLEEAVDRQRRAADRLQRVLGHHFEGSRDQVGSTDSGDDAQQALKSLERSGPSRYGGSHSAGIGIR